MHGFFIHRGLSLLWPPFKVGEFDGFIMIFHKKLKNVSCEYNRLNGWNSTLQAAWDIRRVRIIWFLWTKPTIWSLILSFTQNIVRAYSMFYPYEGYKSVTPLYTCRIGLVVVVFAWNRSLYQTTLLVAVHPVSVLILPSFERYKLCGHNKTVRQRKTKVTNE